MLKATLALVALLAALVAVPAPAGAVGEVETPICYNYIFVADYQWHFLCVNPKDLSCPVYTVVSNHPDYPRGEPRCVVDVPAASGPALAAPRCYMWGQDLDYSHWVCYDLRASDCNVWLETRSGASSWRTCVVGVPTVEFGSNCILVGQDLDYSHYLCYAPGDLSCPVWTETRGGYGGPQRACLTHVTA